MEKKQDHPKEPWLAVVLSFFIAGIGQIYTGRIWRGSILILTESSLICFSIWSVLSPNVDIFVTAGLVLVYVAIWIWNLFDAHKYARMTNSADFEAERKHSKDAWLALFLSKLIPGLGQIYLKRWLWGISFVVTTGILITVGFKYNTFFLVLWAFFSMFVCYHAYISAPIRREPSNKTILIIVIVILCSYLLDNCYRYAFRAYVVEPFILPAGSMKPTLEPGDRLFVRKTRKYVPIFGDVIVFKSPDDPGIPWTKRVAALPGEKLEIKNGILHINGQKTRHPSYQKIEYPSMNYLGMQGEPYMVPENHIFVIGDNSSNSLDSRDFGAIPLSDVIGKAYKIYWPPGRRGPIK